MIINLNIELEVFTQAEYNVFKPIPELNEKQTINVLKEVIKSYNAKAQFQKHTFIENNGVVFLSKITIK